MTINELKDLIDLSCVRTETTMAELESMVAMAKKYRFCCAFAMPCYTQWLLNQLKDDSDIMVGGTIGFPSGADMTETKIFTAQKLVEMGCDELDMVINVQALKNGDDKMVKNDILPIREIAGKRTLKTILEVAYLTDDEIRRACKICADCGVDYVKTGTGWASKPADMAVVNLIRSCVGKNMKIKVAGGVRSIKTIEEMVDAGVSRFGIGIRSMNGILAEMGV